MMISLFIASLLFAGAVPDIQSGSSAWRVNAEAGKPFQELRLRASSSRELLQVAQQGKAAEFKDLLPHVTDAKAFRSKMEEFVELAAIGDTSALMSLMSREAIRSVGSARIQELLEKDVVPFFSQYESLHNVTVISSAVGPSGHVGYWFYTYIRTATAEVRPFAIVVVREEERLVVSDVIVNTCRPNRHPFCP